MAQVVAALALDRRPRMERVHLVDAHAVELGVVRLEHVDEPDGLAVGHRDDHVGLRRDVVEHRLGGDRPGHDASAARAAASPGTPCTAPPGNAAALPRYRPFIGVR